METIGANWAHKKGGGPVKSPESGVQIPSSDGDNDRLLFYLLSSHMINLSALLF